MEVDDLPATKEPKKRPPGSVITLRFDTPEAVAAIRRKARAAGYRSTEEYCRRVLLGLEPAQPDQELRKDG